MQSSIRHIALYSTAILSALCVLSRPTYAELTDLDLGIIAVETGFDDILFKKDGTRVGKLSNGAVAINYSIGTGIDKAIDPKKKDLCHKFKETTQDVAKVFTCLTRKNVFVVTMTLNDNNDNKKDDNYVGYPANFWFAKNQFITSKDLLNMIYSFRGLSNEEYALKHRKTEFKTNLKLPDYKTIENQDF